MPQNYYSRDTDKIEDSIHKELEKERKELKSAFETIKTELNNQGITGLGTLYEPGDKPIQKSLHEEIKKERQKIASALNIIETQLSNAGVSVSDIYTASGYKIKDSFMQELKMEREKFINAFQTVDDKVTTLKNMASHLYDPDNWDSLIHYWPFDNGSDDAVGSLDLTSEGNPSTTTGVSNGAYSYDGVDDGFENSNATGLPTNGITFCSWVSLASTGKNIGLPVHVDTDDGGNFGMIFNEGSGTFAGIARDAETNGVILVSGPSASVDTTYHLAFTHDGSEIELFVNGSSVGTKTFDAEVGYPGSRLILGKAQTSGSTTYPELNFLDECMVFDKALSSSEISTLYQAV
jgi:hypothetical protein